MFSPAALSKFSATINGMVLEANSIVPPVVPYCNGESSDGWGRSKQLTDSQLQEMAEAVPLEQEKFKNANADSLGRHGGFHLGYRFRSINRIIDRILSKTTIEDMLARKSEWIQAALTDCASADHWYTYEKDWN